MPISPAALFYFAYIFCSRKVENLLVLLSFVDIVFISIILIKKKMAVIANSAAVVFFSTRVLFEKEGFGRKST
jgi:hypothetical protein